MPGVMVKINNMSQCLHSANILANLYSVNNQSNIQSPHLAINFPLWIQAISHHGPPNKTEQTLHTKFKTSLFHMKDHTTSDPHSCFDQQDPNVSASRDPRWGGHPTIKPLLDKMHQPVRILGGVIILRLSSCWVKCVRVRILDGVIIRLFHVE